MCKKNKKLLLEISIINNYYFGEKGKLTFVCPKINTWKRKRNKKGSFDVKIWAS